MENYYVVLLFLIYSFLGWVLEVSYSAVKKGKLINRGFLNGAWCPIYGAGAILILYLLIPLEDNIPLLFTASVFVTSLLEFLTGFVLKKIYNTTWWDYSDRKFNIKGYVCLECSIFWGIISVFLVKVLNPLIEAPIKLLPIWLGLTATAALSVLFITDCIVTVLTMNNLCSQLESLEKIAAEMRQISDELSVTVYEGASELKEFKETNDLRLRELKETNKTRFKEQLGEFKEKVEANERYMQRRRETNEVRMNELKEKYRLLFSEIKHRRKRLLAAFPNIKNEKYQSQLDKLTKHLRRGDENV
ncbi:MAG: hypothetical protein LUD77_08600 [Clostridiales bacterium]|nr:hypothetical protein [Clostridiales bacterium]